MRAAGLTETVAKAAAGALEYVPVVKVVNYVLSRAAADGASERLEECLAAIDRNLVLQFQRFRLILAMHGSIEGSARQHREIIAAFRARDAELAESLVRKNAAYGKKLLLKELAA